MVTVRAGALVQPGQMAYASMHNSMTDTAQWICPACNTPMTTPYCPACGERQPHPHELTLRGLLYQAVEAFTSLDARLWRSLGNLLTSSAAYITRLEPCKSVAG